MKKVCMDENYLDQLLKNVENEVMTEEELESPNPSISELVIPETEPELEETLARDAENIQDVAWADSEIPVEELSELDQLDELADMDMNSMDFEDIDFDDVDITKMKMDPVSFEKEMEDLSELNISETYLDETDDPALEQALQSLSELENTDDGYVDTLSGDEGYIDTLIEAVGNSSDSPMTEMPDLSMDMDMSGDGADVDLDSLINEVFSDAGAVGESLETVSEPEEKKADMEALNQSLMDTTSSSNDNENMEELFAMLGIEGNPDAAASIPETDEIPDFEIPPELADVPDISEKKKKRNRFLDILFGDDEEDELTPEQEAELAKKKEEKLQAKLEKKEQKKMQKAENDAKRKSAKEGKSAKLAEKKAARKAEDEKLLAEEGPDKKLNKVLVALVMIFFF